MWVLLLKPASFLPSAFVLFGQNYHSSQQKDPTWNEPRKCLSWGPAGVDGHCRIVRMDRLSLAPPMLRHLHIWLLLPGGEHIDAKPMAGPLLWCTQYWKESTRFIWNTVVSFHSVVFFNFLLLGPVLLFLRQLHFNLNPSLEPAPPLSSIKQSSFQIPPPVSCQWLPSPAHNSLQKSIVPNSCHIKLEHGPGTLTSFPVSYSKHDTKHGTLGPGLVLSTSFQTSTTATNFISTEPGSMCSESFTHFPVACRSKSSNKEAWGSNKVSHLEHPYAWASSVKQLSHLVFVTTETEPRLESLSCGPHSVL